MKTVYIAYLLACINAWMSYITASSPLPGVVMAIAQFLPVLIVEISLSKKKRGIDWFRNAEPPLHAGMMTFVGWSLLFMQIGLLSYRLSSQSIV